MNKQRKAFHKAFQASRRDVWQLQRLVAKVLGA